MTNVSVKLLGHCSVGELGDVLSASPADAADLTNGVNPLAEYVHAADDNRPVLSGPYAPGDPRIPLLGTRGQLTYSGDE